jgi:hypothetical protein
VDTFSPFVFTFRLLVFRFLWYSIAAENGRERENSSEPRLFVIVIVIGQTKDRRLRMNLSMQTIALKIKALQEAGAEKSFPGGLAG